MATAIGYLDVLLTLDTKSKLDTNQNTQAYVVCEEDVIFGIVDEATSTDFPGGNTKIAWIGLNKQSEPNNGAMKVQMKSDFQ
jgi:hypothetical protein